MKITIIGGGNMGGAIAIGLGSGTIFAPQDITVIDRNQRNINYIKTYNNGINGVINDYSSLSEADIIVLAVKPWYIQEVLEKHRKAFNPYQIIISIASGISLNQLSEWILSDSAIYRVMPNTAIAIKESMSFVASYGANKENDELILKIFSELGKAELIDEKLFPAVTSLTSCGIAFAFRYIRAAMEGGVEMGLRPDQAKQAIIQTLRGAANLLETNNSHPEVEIDKVTTAGGTTIKGLNEMENAGFTSAVIKGLKASYVK
ncbi:pyrroline-5-carboxylate reductase [Dysgonomonas alginatilytica]|uniref:Pyrroline-5-carboxylate reductase n=1 Tax=Dysgonomonas alginatilytica TaxID=1605892 RepID=A0A2V3PR81_9BACT|nr:pyrroline-5-carboxylate reductase [Dysgonomonas alginatilytica]PXV64466.1 pyrroline-5-carboxylate reductase [Dysgonomonas alginatilytica]